MHQRQLGPFTVSALGLGCMNMSMGYGPRPEDEDSGRLLNEALDAGYTFLDTASMYGDGHNETLIGRYLSDRRDAYVLASKCGIWRNAEDRSETNGRPEVLMKTCEDSLRRLNTEVIDLYYLHRVDKNVPVEESIGALSRMVEQGKVQTIGMSEVASDTLRRGHATHPITAVQSEYSLWSRTPERGVLDTCLELGVTFVPFSPLARQFLTGRSEDVTAYPDNDIRCTIARPRFEVDAFAENRKLLIPFKEVADRIGCNMAQLALAWLLNRDETVIPIPGTKTPQYMKENAGAGDIKLDADTVAELDAMINEDTVVGRRYTDKLMDNIDSEREPRA